MIEKSIKNIYNIVTFIRARNSVNRVSESEPECHGFESHRAHFTNHKYIKLSIHDINVD